MISTIAIEQGLTLNNAFNNETFIFSGPVDDPTVARFDVRLEQGGSGGGNALVHIHPGVDEHFTVRIRTHQSRGIRPGTSDRTW